MQQILNYLVIFITLHCIADYPLQGDFLAKFKESNLFLMIVHCCIWAGVLTIGMMVIKPTSFLDFFHLAIIHFLIDKWKVTRKDKTKALTKYLYIDQGLHLLQILFLFYTKGIFNIQ